MKNNLINKESGIIHALSNTKDYVLCNNIPMIEIKTGQFIPSTVAFLEVTNERATCKTCLRILKKKEKILCKLPNCIYYDKGATMYCCDACSADAFDDECLSEEERDIEKKRERFVKNIKERIKDWHVNFPIKLEKKALEALEYFIEKQADIYETTSLPTILTQIIENHCAYLKEDLF